MNGWLGQVRLRLPVERPSTFLGQARLVQGYELGRPVEHYHLGQLSCCNSPDGKGYCFDTSSGKCVMTWESPSGTPGNPMCVKDSTGQWRHPSCPEPQPVMAANPEVVAPVQVGTCPTGEMLIEGQCSAGAIACPTGGTYDLLEIDSNSNVTGRILARGLPYSKVSNAAGVSVVNVSDPRCKTQSPTRIATAQPSAQTVTQPASSDYSDPLPATEAAVLPSRGPMTRQSLPTGDWNGSPFQQRPVVMVAQTPKPMPEPCPLGPVPMAEWLKGCMGIDKT